MTQLNVHKMAAVLSGDLGVAFNLTAYYHVQLVLNLIAYGIIGF